MEIRVLILFLLMTGVAFGHETDEQPGAVKSVWQDGKVTYLGNTGLLVDHQEQQILFDPFFHNHYNHYQLVPAEIRAAIFDKKTPYDSVEMVLISHAHGDHFDAKDVVKYLKLNPPTQLVAPTQAIEQLRSISGFHEIEAQTHGLDLAYGDDPIELVFDEIKVGVVRIPHAGWPGRADVSNLVYRVTLNDVVTVMHMGDADPNDEHFKPWDTYWKKQRTNHAFPPYWFLSGSAGISILRERIHSDDYTGVHVPVVVPDQLKYSGADYFSEPGKMLILKPVKKTNNQ